MPFPSFPTYDDFLSAFGVSLNIENFVEIYPEYSDEFDNDVDINLKYVSHFLEGGLDPQVGLEKMIYCLIMNPRYAVEAVDYIIDPFITAGASLTPLTSCLFQIAATATATVTATTANMIEDVVPSIDVCAAIIDRYWRQMDAAHVQSVTDWSTVVPKYWEYIKNVDLRTAYLMYYKCCSDYLRGEHTLHRSELKRAHAKQKFMQRMMGEGVEDEDDDYNYDTCKQCGSGLGCRCDDHCDDHCDDGDDSTRPLHHCGSTDCDGGCGVLACGCIDVCRCRCDNEDM